jgi:hypothetical protein
MSLSGCSILASHRVCDILKVGSWVREKVCMATNELSAYERNVAAVVEKARGCLTEILQESGTILYSSCETLKPSDYYFLGVNPGGSPEETDETIQQSLDELRALTKRTYQNAYLDQCWCGKECMGCCRPLQKRFEFLFRVVLEVEPRTVCATNLIFKRSRSERDAGGWKLAERCWPVHDVILKIVQPCAIITFGRLPFDFIRKKLNGTSPAAEESGHGNWQWRSSKLETGQVLIGLPHLSRYAPQIKVNEDVRKHLGLPPRLTI